MPKSGRNPRSTRSSRKRRASKPAKRARAATKGANKRWQKGKYFGQPKKKAAERPTLFVKYRTRGRTLAEVVGSEPMPRTEVTKKLWAYIRKNKLDDPKRSAVVVVSGDRPSGNPALRYFANKLSRL